MRFSPEASSRDAKKFEPAARGRDETVMPDEIKAGFCRGATMAVEFKGRNDNEVGTVDISAPVKLVTTGPHCCISEKLNLRPRAGTTSIPRASMRRSRPATRSMVKLEAPAPGEEKKEMRRGRKERRQPCR